MTRFSIGTLVATLIVGPWGGCEHEPVAPPATPPPERALDWGSVGSSGTLLINDAHRRG
jgi:hypothetical protein